MITDDEILDELVDIGAICSNDENKLTVLRRLKEQGLALRCSDIPHHGSMINPSYTYVTNDDKGKRLALRPLFTSVVDHAVLALKRM